MDLLDNRYRALSLNTIEEHGQYYKVIADTRNHPEHCCFCLSSNLIPHGINTSYLNDTPYHGLKVYLFVSKRRYKCGDCHKTFQEEIPYQYKKLRMTKYFAKYVRKELKTTSLFCLSRKLRVGRPTLLNAIS